MKYNGLVIETCCAVLSLFVASNYFVSVNSYKFVTICFNHAVFYRFETTALDFIHK